MKFFLNKKQRGLNKIYDHCQTFYHINSVLDIQGRAGKMGRPNLFWPDLLLAHKKKVMLD